MSFLLAASSAEESFVDIDVPLWAWGALIALIVAMLAVDLILHRKPHAPSPRRALIESGVWVSMGLAFAIVIAIAFNGAASGEYLAGYLIEKSLSVDNVFVWAVIFSTFADPREVPAPRLVLGHLRRADPAGDLHRRRRQPHQPLLVAARRVRRVPDLHRLQGAASPRRRRYARSRPCGAHAGSGHAGEQRTRRAALLHQVERQARRDSFARRARRRRVHRRDLRGRLGARRARGQPRAVHRVRIQRVRYPRSTRRVLLARGLARSVALSRPRARCHLDLRRSEDDGVALVSHADHACRSV